MLSVESMSCSASIFLEVGVLLFHDIQTAAQRWIIGLVDGLRGVPCNMGVFVRRPPEHMVFIVVSVFSHKIEGTSLKSKTNPNGFASVRTALQIRLLLYDPNPHWSLWALAWMFNVVGCSHAYDLAC